MKRNRSIRTLPLDNLNFLQHPLPETPKDEHEKLYFGEKVAKESSFKISHYLSSDDSDIILTSVRDFSSKSSSSSLSWGDECKSEASKKVKDELERMDRVLMGLEPIPDNYDKEEYEEWMTFFPNLCVVGKRIGSFSENCVKSTNQRDEMLAIHPEVICDKIELNSEVKKAVIDQNYDKISRNNNIPKVCLSNNVDIDSFLKVSAIGTSKLSKRQSSSRSLISSQISSSKWLKDEEYDSLPFLVCVKPEKTAPPKGILKNSLVLPPIEATPFRSISATPRRESKSLSALSMKDQKYSGFKRKVEKDLYK